MHTERPRLAVDMDEVIADAHGMHATWLTDTYGYDWSLTDLRGTSLRSLASAEHNDAWEEKLQQGDVFEAFDLMPGSRAALAALMERFDVFITTAAMEVPASCSAKFAWLRQHFPFISPMNIVFCGDKSIIAADLLVDDNVRHFARFKGQGVLFSAPHNLAVDWPMRVSDWEDAVAVLTAWADRHDCR